MSLSLGQSKSFKNGHLVTGDHPNMEVPQSSCACVCARYHILSREGEIRSLIDVVRSIFEFTRFDLVTGEHPLKEVTSNDSAVLVLVIIIVEA